MYRIKTIKNIGKKEFLELIRYKDWIINMLIWPVIFPLLYILSAVALAGKDGSGLKNFEALTGTTDYKSFILIGSMVYMWVNMTMWSFGTFLRQEQKKGTLESLWICPIKKFDILLGGASITVIRSALYVLVSLLEYKILYGTQFQGGILEWIVIFIVLLPGVIGIGAIFSCLVLWVKEANVAVMLVRGLVMALCGISFPIIIMPNVLQGVSKCLSFTFGIEAARGIMLNGLGILGVKEDLIKCLLVGIIYIIIGRISFYFVERKVRIEGSLSRF